MTLHAKKNEKKKKNQQEWNSGINRNETDLIQLFYGKTLIFPGLGCAVFGMGSAFRNVFKVELPNHHL